MFIVETIEAAYHLNLTSLDKLAGEWRLLKEFGDGEEQEAHRYALAHRDAVEGTFPVVRVRRQTRDGGKLQSRTELIMQRGEWPQKKRRTRKAA